MPHLQAEKLCRRQINESVLGTNAMEGLTLDDESLALMRRREEGELTRQPGAPPSAQSHRASGGAERHDTQA